jgi:hypothetical protein
MQKRFIKGKVKLKEHIERLDQNKKAGIKEIKLLLPKIKNKFKDAGWHFSSENEEFLFEYIKLIFETQDFRCTHWLQTEGDEINGSWNAPGTNYYLWKTNIIYYEIDHVYPCNAGGKDNLENFQFLSANANRFIKCSLVYKDLLKRVDLSDRLKDRIRDVLAKRKALFKSEKWKKYIEKLENYEKKCRNELDITIRS